MGVALIAGAYLVILMLPCSAGVAKQQAAQVQPLTAGSAMPQLAQHSHIKLSDLQPEQAQAASHHHAVSTVAGHEADWPVSESTNAVEENPAYLHMLASLAQEGELSSPGHSDTEDTEPSLAGVTSPNREIAHTAANTCDGVTAGRDSADLQHPTQTSSKVAAVPASASPEDDAVGSVQEEEVSPLAAALAALVAGVQQAQQQLGDSAQHAQQAQQAQQQAAGQPDLEAASSPASADDDDQASVSSESNGDLLADAAAAATAAGLSPTAQVQPSTPHALPQDAAARDTVMYETSPWSHVTQQGSQQAKHAMFSDQFEQSAAPQARQGLKQAKHAMFADQEEFEPQQAKQQRQTGSGDYVGPASSAPSWSGSAAGVGRFKDNQSINYVGKSARRPKVSTTVNTKQGVAMLCCALLIVARLQDEPSGSTIATQDKVL